jgi:serine/threonine-protein kinase
MHEAVVPPSRRCSRLGPAWDEVLLKLLARSHHDRYAKTEDILGALDRLELSWQTLDAGVRPPAAPLLRDASLAGLRGAESVLGFEASASSVMPDPGDHKLGTLGAVPVVPKALEKPTSIAEYDILGLAGRGGMGIVYKARDRRLDRVVALKVFPGLVIQGKHYFDSAIHQHLKRFQTEAKAVARLQHAHIVQIHGIGKHDGQAYIALEYVAGGSLADKLRTETLAPSAAAEMVAKLARAVHHAHEHGVLHRDLKPSNVLLTLDGEPKIGDFGLAKIQELSKEDAALTHSGMIIGTPSYMAPEQAAGEINMIGPAADIYSLGAILYVSLTGRPPFQGESVMRMLSQLATAPVIPPNTLNPAVSVDLSAICVKCLEKDPAKRYNSAKALAEDLERWRTGQPIQARPASSINRLLRWCRRSLANLFLFRKHS